MWCVLMTIVFPAGLKMAERCYAIWQRRAETMMSRDGGTYIVNLIDSKKK